MAYLDRRHRSNLPAIQQMDCIVGRCTRDTIRALDAAGTLRAKQEQLSHLFTYPQKSTSEARGLTLEIQRLSGAFFATVSSIKQSLDEIDIHAQSLRTPTKSTSSWWRKLLGWIRDLLNLAMIVTALIPGLNVAISALCGLGAGLATIAHSWIQPDAPRYSALSAAVEHTSVTRETLSEIMAFQPELDSTTGQALSLLDEYDAMKRMLAQIQGAAQTYVVSVA
jgi:hypothetical protein